MIYTVTQQKGGVGKSTIAAHMAVAMAYIAADQNAGKVALVDTDPQASLTAWHGLREQNKMVKADLDFYAVNGWQLEGELRRLKQHYNYIVIDTPPHADSDNRAAIRIADLVILPMQPSPLDLWAGAASLSVIARQSKESLIVLNRVNPRTNILAQTHDTLESQGLKAAQALIGNRTAFADSMGQGLSVMETQPRGPAAYEFLVLMKEILER